MSKVKIADEKTDLRRGIDHIGVSVCSVIHDGNGRILLMKRGPEARDENGCWDICGGAVEFGESIDEAVKREVHEELCAKPIEIDFVTAYDAHREHDGNKTHWVALVHVVKVDPGRVRIGEPHKISEIGWFTKDTLPEPRHSQFDKSFSQILPLGIVK
ncbi:NUDIX domain-containing protein [Candidatus Saccharibacteria bacterium]|nr:NUDIX domain-containing protein [Candidatus Saccharibacteria bacterium]